MSNIVGKLEDMRRYLDTDLHPVVSPDRWDVYASLCDMVDETLDLLKEQEPVKPVPDTSYGARPWWFVCGNCKLSVNEDQKYCPNCGRKVWWE